MRRIHHEVIYLQFLAGGTRLECKLGMKNPTLKDLKKEVAKLMSKKCFAQIDRFGFLGQEVKNKALKKSTLLSDIVSKIKLINSGKNLSDNKISDETLLSDLCLENEDIVHVVFEKEELDLSLISSSSDLWLKDNDILDEALNIKRNIASTLSPISLFQQSFQTLLDTACQRGTPALQKILKDENNEVVVKGVVTILNDFQFRKF